MEYAKHEIKLFLSEIYPEEVLKDECLDFIEKSYNALSFWGIVDKQNKNLNVDSYEKIQDHTTLLDEKTTLLEDNEKTVLLMEQPIGRLIPENHELSEIVISDNGFIIGSSAEGTDYQIEGTGISRRHLKFYKEEEKVCCEDLNSTNGVKINGRKISKCLLYDGDRIKIGLEEFLFKEE